MYAIWQEATCMYCKNYNYSCSTDRGGKNMHFDELIQIEFSGPTGPMLVQYILWESSEYAND